MAGSASFVVLTAIILYVVESATSEQLGESYLPGFDELFGGRERRDSTRAFLQQLMQRLKPRFRRDYATNERDITDL
uniref:Uncharacterized protein n=1 Tax=Parascaris univalens TaxID=6257 RepID=A0A915ABU3_PARUN